MHPCPRWCTIAFLLCLIGTNESVAKFHRRRKEIHFKRCLDDSDDRTSPLAKSLWKKRSPSSGKHSFRLMKLKLQLEGERNDTDSDDNDSSSTSGPDPELRYGSIMFRVMDGRGYIFAIVVVWKLRNKNKQNT